MNRNISLFVDKFRVKGEIKNSIHKFLRDEEIVILNYLVDKEVNISNLISEFSPSSVSLIESLYEKGYLDKQSKKGDIYYKSNPFELILKRFINHNPKYQELAAVDKAQFQKAVMDLALEEMRSSEKPVYRVIPVEETIKDKRQLIPHHKAIHYLQRAAAISVIDCLCRMTHNRCDKPRRVCLALGEKAKFFIERGIGAEISVQEGLEILKISVENGLVHSINDTENPHYLCNCCECCCVFVQGLKKYGVFSSMGRSGFIASRDLELCTECGTCLEYCIFDAITEENDGIQFNQDKCFGCGLCAHNCPQSAVQLIVSNKVDE